MRMTTFTQLCHWLVCSVLDSLHVFEMFHNIELYRTAIFKLVQLSSKFNILLRTLQTKWNTGCSIALDENSCGMVQYTSND